MLAAAVLLAGCREQQVQEPGFVAEPRLEQGAPRPYLLGFSTLPAELNEESYRESFDLAARFGELLLIQRAPAWADFLPGVEPSAALEDVTVRERTAVEERGLGLLYALDPFDPADRGRLAATPAGYERADLGHPDLRAAFVAEARFIAANYEPRYIALGIEVNATFERSPAQYAAFVAAYREAHDAVQEVSPQTLVFATFQYEQLLGVVPWEPPRPPRWELLDDFAGRLDLFALAPFPSVTYEVARALPPLYYRQIRDHTALPIAFAAVGYSSARGREGLNSSTPAEQRRFLQRLLADSDALAAPFVVWFASRDPAFASDPPSDLLASIGLRDARDQPKEAWTVWAETSTRPYAPRSAELGAP
ncbi:MAG: hypothetical protein O2895_00855 [Chloroflexi bacterium]|nr:hypothetical protein [Chloroflexota bacterium]